jgi:hypothetical protein
MMLPRLFLAVVILSLICLPGCGGSNDSDGAGNDELEPDSSEISSSGTLRDAANEILQPQQPISGAQNLINEAESAADQANERTETLQEMMGDM